MPGALWPCLFGLAVFAIGLWYALKPDSAAELERREVEESPWLPRFWRETRLSHIDAPGHRAGLRFRGVLVMLAGAALTAMALRGAGFW